MNVDILDGKYVIGVSGGVDSMVLLNLLTKLNSIDIIVAHFDHGIREDSDKDCDFVAATARRLGLKFYSKKGKLGTNASEQTARDARYEFLNKIKEKTKSQAIITAHHQDDVLETMVLNILRGTNRKGLSSLKDQSDIKRPLLKYSKVEILNYALENNLDWREDPTNTNDKYLRNYVRKRFIPKISSEQRKLLLEIATKSAINDKEIENIFKLITLSDSKINKDFFNRLDHSVAMEFIADLLRKNDIEFDRKLLESAVIFCKTSQKNKMLSLSSGKYLVNEQNFISLKVDKK